MKTEVRTKTVQYRVFIAEDGKVFEKKKDCELHERLLRGEIKECPECHGEGRINKWEVWENYHTGVPEKMLGRHVCDKCHGKGYLEKKVIWE